MPDTPPARSEIPPAQYVKRPRVVLGLGVTLVVLVALVGLVIPARPLDVDLRWLEAMRDVQTRALQDVALVFNYLGRGLGRALSLGVIGVVLAVGRRWWALLAFAVAESVTPIANNLTKHLVDRPRPPGGLLQAAGSSFPSGHVAYAGATAVALVLLFTRPGAHRRVWWILAALAVAGMAWSRTYLQVHWLTDVVAGALLGVGITLVSFATTQLGVRDGAKLRVRSDGGQRQEQPGQGES